MGLARALEAQGGEAGFYRGSLSLVREPHDLGEVLLTDGEGEELDEESRLVPRAEELARPQGRELCGKGVLRRKGREAGVDYGVQDFARAGLAPEGG